MTRFSDRRLQDAFAEPAARDAGAAGEHVEAETLWSLAAGEIEKDAAAAAVDHLARCASCAEDYRLTRELVIESRRRPEDRDAGGVLVGLPAAGSAADPAAASTPASTRRSTHRSTTPRRWRPALAAAALLVLAAGVWLLLPRGPEPPAPYREAPVESAIRTPIAAGETMDRSAVELRWAPINGARYELLVTTEQLDVVAEARFLEESRFRVDEGALRHLPAGAKLIWQVEAVLPGGERVSSPAFEIVLGGAPADEQSPDTGR